MLETEQSLFKKRKRPESLRKGITNDSSKLTNLNENTEDDPTQSILQAKKRKTKSLLSSSTVKDDQKVEMFSFDSSHTALRAGKEDQGATVFDEDLEDRIREKIEKEERKEQHKKEMEQDKEDRKNKTRIVPDENEKRFWSGEKNERFKQKKIAGPLRAPANIRITCRFDYNPSRCKDYYETGYCGYGDNCKFVHDRTEYKPSYEIDREWEEEQKKKRLGTYKEEDDDQYYIGRVEMDDEPPTCMKCNKDFVNPVVTKCDHYFCEDCATKQEKLDGKCFVCKAVTGGTFTVITDLSQHIFKIKQYKKEIKAEEETSDGSDFEEVVVSGYHDMVAKYVSPF